MHIDENLTRPGGREWDFAQLEAALISEEGGSHDDRRKCSAA